MEKQKTNSFNQFPTLSSESCVLSSSIAFKEWAAVVRALASGEQILILRKGGIHEKEKKFHILHKSFLLFPTYEHQNPEDLNPRGQKLLAETLSESRDTTQLSIEYFASMQESLWVGDLKKIEALAPFHIWSDHALQKRFDYGSEKGFYALTVRVFKLAEKALLPNLSRYGGCRSWVDLSSGVSLSQMQPVLTDSSFKSQQEQVKRAFA